LRGKIKKIPPEMQAKCPLRVPQKTTKAPPKISQKKRKKKLGASGRKNTLHDDGKQNRRTPEKEDAREVEPKDNQ